MRAPIFVAPACQDPAHFWETGWFTIVLEASSHHRVACAGSLMCPALFTVRFDYPKISPPSPLEEMNLDVRWQSDYIYWYHKLAPLISLFPCLHSVCIPWGYVLVRPFCTETKPSFQMICMDVALLIEFLNHIEKATSRKVQRIVCTCINSVSPFLLKSTNIS